MAALALDLLALLRQRQPVDFHHVVEHARENAYHLAELVPVKPGAVGKGLAHEFGEVDRTQETSAVRRQALLAALSRDQAVEHPGIVGGLSGVKDRAVARQ